MGHPDVLEGASLRSAFEDCAAQTDASCDAYVSEDPGKCADNSYEAVSCQQDCCNYGYCDVCKPRPRFRPKAVPFLWLRRTAEAGAQSGGRPSWWSAAATPAPSSYFSRHFTNINMTSLGR